MTLKTTIFLFVMALNIIVGTISNVSLCWNGFNRESCSPLIKQTTGRIFGINYNLNADVKNLSQHPNPAEKMKIMVSLFLNIFTYLVAFLLCYKISRKLVGFSEGEGGGRLLSTIIVFIVIFLIFACIEMLYTWFVLGVREIIYPFSGFVSLIKNYQIIFV